jgi:hypothetical protein
MPTLAGSTGLMNLKIFLKDCRSNAEPPSMWSSSLASLNSQISLFNPKLQGGKIPAIHPNLRYPLTVTFSPHNRRIARRFTGTIIVLMFVSSCIRLKADTTRPEIAPGTLAHHLATNALARAYGRSGTPADKLLLSNWTYAQYSRTNLALLTNAVWSPQCWLHGVQGLSATPIGLSNGLGGQGLMTMVSPRHYLCATHMHPEAYLAAFLDTNNVLYWRKTLQRKDVTNDISVGILSADLPPSVGFLPLAPADVAAYLPTNLSIAVQGIGMNQDMLIFSQPMCFALIKGVFWNSRFPVTSGLGTNWNVSIRGGDSSDPDMLLINNQLVLLTHHSSGMAGPAYYLQLSAINRAMHELSRNNHVSTDYQLTRFPLTSWRKLR